MNKLCKKIFTKNIIMITAMLLGAVIKKRPTVLYFSELFSHFMYSLVNFESIYNPRRNNFGP